MVTMARNFDKEFMDGLKNYMKTESMKHGQQTWSKTITEIAEDLTRLNLFNDSTTISARGNKVWQYLTRLENSGAIRIDKGKQKGNPSWYTWLNDIINEQLLEEKEEYLDMTDEIANEANQLTQKIINNQTILSQKIMSLSGELCHYKQAISDLKPFGTSPETGEQFLMAKKGSNINAIIAQVKKELEDESENQKENQKEEDNTTKQ
jgi:hypothetical protein